jgi:prepilin-type N-terminal cleavage/methylation domain-containing protein
MLKRKGLTLLEVLISIFIMGIGMLSVLAMFPAAADMMGRAITNAQMAEGLVNARGMQDGVDWISPSGPYYQYLNAPVWKSPPADLPVFLLLDQYAALVGINRFSNLSIEVGSISGGGITAGRFFTCNSDLILNNQGVANKDDDGNSVSVEREAKFTIAHFFTKPMPITYPNYIKRNILVFKDRSQVITSNDFTYYPITPPQGSVTITNQFVLPANTNGLFKTRQWVMITDSLANAYPSAVDFFEISSVDDSGANTTIEISPSLPSSGFGTRTGAQSVYLLKDVAKVIYTGY